MSLAVLLCASVLTNFGCDKGTESDGNHPPGAPSNPSPANSASDQNVDITLSWQCSDPDGDNLVYDVYCGTEDTPPLVSTDQSAVSYAPGTLQTNSAYYWRVVASDNQGHDTQGPLWSFSTGAQGGLTLVGQYITSGFDPNAYPDLGVCAVGSYAYLANGENGLHVLDVSSSANPTMIAVLDTFLFAWGVHVQDNLGVVIGRTDNTFGLNRRSNVLATVDFTSPAAPHVLSVWDTTSSTVDGPYQLAVSGNHAYTTTNKGILVFDISTPSEPIWVGSYRGYGSNYNPRDIAVSGNHVFVTDRYNGLRILDITSPANPTHVTTYMPQGWYSVNGVYATGNTVYVAETNEGVCCVDITDAANPNLVGNMGARVNRVFVAGSHAFFTSMGNSLRVYNVSDPADPTFVAMTTEESPLDRLFVDGSYVYVVDGWRSGGDTYGLKIYSFSH